MENEQKQNSVDASEDSASDSNGDGRWQGLAQIVLKPLRFVVQRVEKMTSRVRGRHEDGEGDPSEENDEYGAAKALPLRSLSVLGGAVLLLGLGSFFITVYFMDTSEAGRDASSAPAEKGNAEELGLSGLRAKELVSVGDAALESGDITRARDLYRAAWERRRSGEDGALRGGLRLSGLLATAGRGDVALKMLGKIKDNAEIGTSIWRDALIALVGLCGQRGATERLYRNACLLRANVDRYATADTLRAWSEYQIAMARFARATPHRRPDGSPLSLDDLNFGSARPELSGTGQDEASRPTDPAKSGEILLETNATGATVRANRAPISTVLEAFEREAVIEVPAESPNRLRLDVHMEGVPMGRALELALGGRGLVYGHDRAGRAVVRPLRWPEPGSARAIEDALNALERFVMVFSESGYLPEAYYAMSHVYLLQGEEDRSLSQIETALEKFPRSVWSAPSHYMAGWIAGRQGNPASGLRHMQSIQRADEPLLTYAAGMRGHFHRCENNWQDGLDCLEKALENSLPDPFRAKLLYDRAVCLENLDVDRHEVTRAYSALQKNHPSTRYGTLSVRALARIALDEGEPRKAEKLLARGMTTPFGEKISWKDVSGRLVEGFCERDEPMRGALLGEILRERSGGSLGLDMAIIRSASRAQLPNLGLQAVSRILAQDISAAQRGRVLCRQGKLLWQADRPGEAIEALEKAAELAAGKESECEALLCRAEVLIEQQKLDECLKVCRQVLEQGTDADKEERALRLMGRCHVARGEYELAARIYEGEYRVSGKWEKQP